LQVSYQVDHLPLIADILVSRGGIGRTGMVVGSWLVESRIAKNGEEALSIIAQEWKNVEKCRRFPHSPETGPQFEFVRTYRRSP
jgi:hypothetical protein